MKRRSVLQGLALAGCLVGAAADGAQAQIEVPDDAFLEYLGAWESVEGEWIDPVALDALEGESEAADSGIRSGGDEGEDDEDES